MVIVAVRVPVRAPAFLHNRAVRRLRHQRPISALSSLLTLRHQIVAVSIQRVSATMMLGLLLQIASVMLLRCRLGKTWLRRPTVILVLASVVYQGVSPVLLAFPSIGAQDIYRLGVAWSYTDEAVLVTSAGMLAFTMAYLLSRPERAQPRQARRASLARALDWRLLALSCAPLAVLTYEGRGYANGSLTIGAGAPSGTVLASSFFVILMVLTAFSLVLSKGPRVVSARPRRAVPPARRRW